MLQELAYSILKFIGDLNYWHVALLSALESTIFPVIVPVETIVIPMGYYAYLGTKSLPLLIVSCTTGIVAGCLINYAFARYLGRDFIYKHAKILHINIEKLEKLEQKFLAHGRLLMFVGRFVPIPAFKHIITIPAGMAKMPIKQFIFYNALGGFIFSTSMLLIGYFFGSSEELWRQALGRFVVVCLALFAVYLLIRFIISALVKKDKKQDEDDIALEEQEPKLEEVSDNKKAIFLGRMRIGKSNIGNNIDSKSGKNRFLKKSFVKNKKVGEILKKAFGRANKIKKSNFHSSNAWNKKDKKRLSYKKVRK